MPPALAPAAAPAAPAAAPVPGRASAGYRAFSTSWFVLIHIVPFVALAWVGVSVAAVVLAFLMYVLRMLAVTTGYHRLFSHRSYETSRAYAFLVAAAACTAIQKGPLWWASVHRLHHKASDTPEDAHSPVQRGFWWAHMGWICSPAHSTTEWSRVQDWAKFPEIVWLDRWHFVPPILLGAVIFFGGGALAAAFPGLHTSGAQLLVWGMGVSTVVLYHGTWCVNSVLHVWGSKRFKTGDESRNNRFVAWITMGEGWHNNHHRYQASERQGFYPGEIDLGHVFLSMLAKLRVVRRLKVPPESVLEEGRRAL